MDWERASPRSEAVVVVAGDKRSKCNIKSSVNDLKSCPTNTNLTNARSSSPNTSNTNNKTTTTTSTNNTTTTTGQFVSMSRKNKPIPPPLDLSIGAANLSLHHPNLSSPSLPISGSLGNHLHHHHHLNNHHYIHSSSHHSTSGSPSGLHPSWYSPTNQQQQQPPPPTTSSSSSSSSSATASQQLHHTPYLGSPKYTQPDKTLPLRKRWHSWSPILMNGQDESLLPLYSDSHLPTPISGVKQESQQQQQQQQSEMNLTEGGDHHNHSSHSHNHHGNQNHAHSIISLHHQAYPYSVSASSSPSPSTVSTTSSITTPTTNSYRLPSYGHVLSHSHSHHGHGGHHGHGSPLNGHSNPLGLGLSIQTPSPFYTPNEPSPKFMNSPVFSYSTPDTSLYQGPFSPMRSSLYPPPSSPFTNLSLNTPGGPMSTGSGSSLSNSCFSNMIPSTLLSPAPSQTSTNSLSYEDLHEKSSSSSTASGVSGSGSGSGMGGGSGGGGGGNVGGVGVSLNFLNPVWSIFMLGTKVRFTQNHAMSSMDWFPVDYLAQNSEQLFHFKGEYAPHGLEVRTLVMTSSSKERIQITFVPVGDLDHPSIEVDCEPSHPFMVEKKGWCSVKPDVFLESFGAHCPQLICGDICLNISPSSLSSTSRLQPNLSVQLNIQPISQSHHHQQQVCVGGGSSSSNSNNNQISQHSIMSGMTSGSSITIGTGSTSPYSAMSNAMTNNNNNPPNSNPNDTSNNNASAAIINHANAIISLSSNSPPILNLNTNSLTHNLMTLTSVKMEPGMSMDEKSIPISVVPQTQQQQQQQHSSHNLQSVHHLQQQQHHQQQLHHLHSQQQQQRQQQHQSSSPAKKFAVPSSPMNLGSGNGPLPSPAKRVKECHGGQGPQEQKGRRPMNAFLLFAKDKRPELIQQFPGKDNRSISVLLGEAWANLEPPEKEKYSSSARARAEEQKRIHPDCWKRKRSQSTSS